MGEFEKLKEQEGVIIEQIDNIAFINDIKGKEKKELLGNIWGLVENQIQQEELCEQ